MTTWYELSYGGKIRTYEVVKETPTMLVVKDRWDYGTEEETRMSKNGVYPSLVALWEAEVRRQSDNVKWAEQKLQSARSALGVAESELAKAKK